MKKGIDQGWYVNEWMTHLGLRQRDVVKRTGWGRHRINAICQGKAKYADRNVPVLAKAFRIQIYELFIHPDEAMEIREGLELVRKKE